MKLNESFIFCVQFTRNDDLGHDDKKIYFSLQQESGYKTKVCNLKDNHHHHPVLCSFATLVE